MPPEPTPSWYDNPPALEDIGVAITGATSVGDGVWTMEDILGSAEFSIPASVSALKLTVIPCFNAGGVYTSDVSRAVIADRDTQSFVGNSVATGEFLRDGRVILYIGNMLQEGECAVVVITAGASYCGLLWYIADGQVPEQSIISAPICAAGDGGQALPFTLNGTSPNKWAGWQSALPAGGVVRLTGFNMPRTLTSYSGETPTTIIAEGGDYGIEFTIPQDSDSVAIFDETFWLYIR